MPQTLNRIIHEADYREMNVSRRKAWEINMALATLHATRPQEGNQEIAVGLGAGMETTTWKIAPYFDTVIPTDLYNGMGEWKLYGNSDFITHTTRYAPTGYGNVDNVFPQHQDATQLTLPSEFSDFVYGLGSIEHYLLQGQFDYSNFEACAVAMKEAYRILKHGGVMSIATEWKLNDKAGWGFNNVRLFTPETLKRYILDACDLVLLDIPDLNPDYDLNRAMTLDDAIKGDIPSHGEIALSHGGYVFTSLHLAFRKP